jgi:hypothetical protein
MAVIGVIIEFLLIIAYYQTEYVYDVGKQLKTTIMFCLKSFDIVCYND